MSDDKCHVCDRPLPSEADWDVVGYEGKHLCWGERADCEAHRVDWRARSLAQEAEAVARTLQIDDLRGLVSQDVGELLDSICEANRERDDAMRARCQTAWLESKGEDGEPLFGSSREVARMNYPTHAARLYPEGDSQ